MSLTDFIIAVCSGFAVGREAEDALRFGLSELANSLMVLER